jgi:hypothetical protein
VAHTAGLPIGLAQFTLGYAPRANAQVYITPAFVPDFGLMVNKVIPGSNVASNAFYNPGLNYSNTQPNVLLTPNAVENMYLGFIPGIMRMPTGSV